MKRKIIVTMGDPAGCGPAITLKAINEFKSSCELFLVGDRQILSRYPLFRKITNKINLFDLNTPGIKSVKPGFLSSLGGLASLQYCREALKLVKKEKANALVTAPLSKEAVQRVQPGFLGHTEFLAEYFGVSRFAMMMVSDIMRVVLLTRHVPLKKVSTMITKSRIEDTIFTVCSFLKKKFKIRDPRIAFVSFNPHAGKDTFLGKEERVIHHVINKYRKGFYGPYPADTIFLKNKINDYDCIIACYHDQAMIPFKLLSFENGVNVTAGLPIIRTSPDHGVAFDLMRNKKNPLHSSMLAAIKLAYKLSL